MSFKKPIILILVILLIDQVSKIYVKTHFSLGESEHVYHWFKILFIENEGMAWGTKIPGKYGKLFLTLFRLIAVTGIGYWLYISVKANRSKLLVLSISLIFAGALGNIIDSVFYGLLFNDSHQQVATFLPESGGYSGVFYGKVVDMLYFPLWKGYLPTWSPVIGGRFYTFFEPVFNIADTAISGGVALLIFFNKRVFSD
jgi:signal peptidase II